MASKKEHTMKTIRTVRDPKDTGKVMGEVFQLIQNSDLVDFTIHYRKKCPIVWKRTRAGNLVSHRNPNAKKIHTFVLRVDFRPPKLRRLFQVHLRKTKRAPKHATA